MLTISCRITAEAAVSYVASLHTKLTHSMTQRYCVMEKEKRAGSNQGLHGVDLRFHENVILRKGLDGERHIGICVEDLEGSTCICCICTTRLRYTVVHTFGVTTSHSKIIDTVFELKLQCFITIASFFSSLQLRSCIDYDFCSSSFRLR